MERVLQRLGLISKKSSAPYQYRDSSGHAAYSTNKSNPTSHSNFQSNAHGGRKKFGGEHDDLGWMELTVTEGPSGSNEHIVNGPSDVVITTDIVTRYEDVERHTGPSSGVGRISDEDLIRKQTPDTRKVV
jgi:hypothetical protein